MISMMPFSSVSIVDFEQVNVSWDFSEKPDLLPSNYQISKSSYYFVWHYLIVMEFHRKLGQENLFNKRLTINQKEPVSYTKLTIYFLITQSKNFGTFFLTKR